MCDYQTVTQSLDQLAMLEGRGNETPSAVESKSLARLSTPTLELLLIVDAGYVQETGGSKEEAEKLVWQTVNGAIPLYLQLGIRLEVVDLVFLDEGYTDQLINEALAYTQEIESQGRTIRKVSSYSISVNRYLAKWVYGSQGSSGTSKGPWITGRADVHIMFASRRVAHESELGIGSQGTVCSQGISSTWSSVLLMNHPSWESLTSSGVTAVTLAHELGHMALGVSHMDGCSDCAGKDGECIMAHQAGTSAALWSSCTQAEAMRVLQSKTCFWTRDVTSALMSDDRGSVIGSSRAHAAGKEGSSGKESTLIIVILVVASLFLLPIACVAGFAYRRRQQRLRRLPPSSQKPRVRGGSRLSSQRRATPRR